MGSDSNRAARRTKLPENGSNFAGVEDTIATVAEIFTLQGDDRMRELEARFLR